MIKSITINKDYEKWYRLFCAKTEESITLELKDGINIIASPNGKGKTTIMEASQAFLMSKEKPDGVILEPGYSKKDKPAVYFFATKDMEPQRMMDNINPMSSSSTDEVAFWFNRTSLSHGQSTRELMVDINELATNGNAGCIIIDEPEIAMDSDNIVLLINEINKLKTKVQFIIVSHHPWIVLNKDFNVINLDPLVDSQQKAIESMKKLNLIS